MFFFCFGMVINIIFFVKNNNAYLLILYSDLNFWTLVCNFVAIELNWDNLGKKNILKCFFVSFYCSRCPCVSASVHLFISLRCEGILCLSFTSCEFVWWGHSPHYILQTFIVWQSIICPLNTSFGRPTHPLLLSLRYIFCTFCSTEAAILDWINIKSSNVCDIQLYGRYKQKWLDKTLSWLWR